MASERDINVGMIAVQEQARAVAKAAADPTQRARIDEVIHKQAIPSFFAEIQKMGKMVNGWVRPRIIGNFRSDYEMRSITNYAGIWANNSKETIYFTAQGLDGSQTYTQTYPKDALPASKTRYFWSVVAVDSVDFRVIPNSLNRYLFNKQSALKLNDDGSLTLVFAPKQPDGIPESNWLPTPEWQEIQSDLSFLWVVEGRRRRGVLSAATGGAKETGTIWRKAMKNRALKRAAGTGPRTLFDQLFIGG